MATHSIQGIDFEPPGRFVHDEVTYSMVAEPDAALEDKKLLGKQQRIRDNLVIHRRPKARGELSVAIIVGQVVGQLTLQIPNLENVTTEVFNFVDGALGMILGFDVDEGSARLRQYQAVRLDGDIVTTLTLTVDRSRLSQETKATYAKCLASVRLSNHQGAKHDDQTSEPEADDTRRHSSQRRAS